MTDYYIFEEVSVGGEGIQPTQWKRYDRKEARSGASAIRAALNGAENADGTFVAVPARSWRSVTVKVETKTALKFS